MADVLTPEQRTRCMSAIRGKNTKPEMVVRRLVHGMGYRYRLHVRELPGAPDLVFPSRKKVIFVHGCFWHRHNCSLGKPVPATRKEFWTSKFKENKKRDRKNQRKLQELGWDFLLVWECDVRNGDFERLGEKIVEFLGKDTGRDSRKK